MYKIKFINGELLELNTEHFRKEMDFYVFFNKINENSTEKVAFIPLANVQYIFKYKA